MKVGASAENFQVATDLYYVNVTREAVSSE
jgi:hypothetical protein